MPFSGAWFDTVAAVRRSDELEPNEKQFFMSSDPIFSIVQSALEFYFNSPESKYKAADEGSSGGERRKR